MADKDACEDKANDFERETLDNLETIETAWDLAGNLPGSLGDIADAGKEIVESLTGPLKDAVQETANELREQCREEQQANNQTQANQNGPSSGNEANSNQEPSAGNDQGSEQSEANQSEQSSGNEANSCQDQGASNEQGSEQEHEHSM